MYTGPVATSNRTRNPLALQFQVGDAAQWQLWTGK